MIEFINTCYLCLDRLVGDLIYLDVITLEGHKYCITGSTRNFYVNASTPSVFDCKPAKPANEATTLIGLLQKISSKFKKGRMMFVNLYMQFFMLGNLS